MAESTDIIERLTPHIPMIGITVGVIIIGKYITDGICAACKATQTSQEQEEEDQ